MFDAGLVDRFLNRDEERSLLRMARAAVKAAVRNEALEAPVGIEVTPALVEQHGAFVTLRKHAALRGCMGTISNAQPLLTAVCNSAMRSALRDPRFSPVALDEVDALSIEVSALGLGDTPDTPFLRIREVSEILIGRDGVMLRHGSGRSGLLLPQVASERGWGVEQFLEAVCAKACVSRNGWRDPEAELYRFSAQVFSEVDV